MELVNRTNGNGTSRTSIEDAYETYTEEVALDQIDLGTRDSRCGRSSMRPR
jgi:hypothetical protein